MTDIERRIDFLQGQMAMVASVLATMLRAAEQQGVGISRQTAEEFISKISIDEGTTAAMQDGMVFQGNEIQRILNELRKMK